MKSMNLYYLPNVQKKASDQKPLEVTSPKLLLLTLQPWHTLLYKPLHRDNWGLILVLRLRKHKSIQWAPDINFEQLMTIYRKITSIYYQDMTCIHDTYNL